MWNAANIYAPTLVIAGQYDTGSYPEDREGLTRDLVHAPVKRSALIPDATHFVLFEKNRFQFFDAIPEISEGVVQGKETCSYRRAPYLRAGQDSVP